MSAADYITGSDSVLIDRLMVEPIDAVDDLLFARVYPHAADLDVADHIDRLISVLGPKADRLDAAATAWIEARWPPQTDEVTSPTADAWIELCRSVVRHGSLEHAHAALVERFPEREGALDRLSEGPSRDPLRWYLHAVARWQRDHRLISEWWDLCDLKFGQPWYRGEVGLLGLAHLPPEGVTDSGFSTAVVLGTVRYGLALARHATEGTVPSTEARRHFVAAAQRMRRSFPIPELWAETLGATDAALTGLPPAWIRFAFPHVDLFKRTGTTPVRVRILPAPRRAEWRDVATEIARALARDPDPRRAEAFLDEQRQHAGRTGESDPLVRSLTFFADRVLSRAPALARQWSAEALSWDPFRDASWTAYVGALLREGDFSTACVEALRGYELVPWQVNSHHLLGRALEQAGQPELAEVVQRLGMQRFPDDPYPPSGLAHVMIAQGRYAEAAEHARAALRVFPGNAYLETWLAIALAATGEHSRDEVVALLKSAASRSDRPPVTTAALTKVEADDAVLELIQKPPRAWTPEGLAALCIQRLVRNAARFGITAVTEGRRSAASVRLGPRSAAEDLLDGVALGEPNRVRTLNEQAESARRMFPGSVEVVFAQIKVRLAEARLSGQRFGSPQASAVMRDLEYLGSLRTMSAIPHHLLRLDSLSAYLDGSALDEQLAASFARVQSALRSDVGGASVGPSVFAAALAVGVGPGDGGPRLWLDRHRALVDDTEEAGVFALAPTT